MNNKYKMLGHCNHQHCNCHRHKNYVKMVKFVMLFAFFVALVPGVLLTLNFGLKSKMAPVLIHGFIFALVYSVISHAYWRHIKHQHMNNMRQQATLEKLDRVRMHQDHQEALLSTLAAVATKCGK